MINTFIIFLLTLSITLNIFISSEVLGIGEETYFFDLNIDNYESINQIDNSDYQTDITYLKDRITYWKSKYRSPLYPNSTNELLAYDEAGGIVPFNTIEDFDPIKIDIKYKNIQSQPNIVFVLIDDWGYNNLGYRSTMMPFVTPTIDKLITKGILLENYYTYEFCAPSRGALLTGRYVLRLGLEVDEPSSELPLDEITLTQELKSAGYRNYMIGKWHLGYSTYYHLPNQRGFDYFYGYYNAEEDYWTKSVEGDNKISYLDLSVNNKLVTNENEIDNDIHSGYLFQSKVEQAIVYHNKKYSDVPMFLYYPLQLVHYPYEAPEIYKSRCKYPDDLSDTLATETQTYCAMNLMVDEAIANLTCALTKAKMMDNTIIIISGDNGGASNIDGDSYPFRGYKHTFFRGGVSNTAVLYGPEPWIPQSKRGSTYSGQVHITDWLPTIMGLATNGEWTGSYNGNEIDGIDMWSTILNNQPSLHDEIVFLLHDDNAVIQYNMKKLLINVKGYDVINPLATFEKDQNPSGRYTSCENTKISLIRSLYDHTINFVRKLLN